MTVHDPWKPFEDATEAPWQWARSWKEKTGGKVIGHLLPDVPEEIIHAGGALPVAVAGAGTPPAQAEHHLPAYACSHAMGALEVGFQQGMQLLDGMIIPYVCDTTRNLFHIWSQCFPDMTNDFLRIPKLVDSPEAREYLKAEYSRMLQTVASVTGRQPGLEDLARSISVYDRSRGLLRKAYGQHRRQPTVWTGRRVQTLFISGMKVPREEHLAWMEDLPWNGEPDLLHDRTLLYVRGKVWDPPGILTLFDDIGFVLAADEIVTGYRAVGSDAGSELNPMDALVARHFALVPYAGYHHDPREMVRSFVDRVRTSGAQGALFLNPKFCEAAAFDTPDFQKALDDAGIPHLTLETSTRGSSPAQLRLRLEAFREMITGVLP